MDAIIGRGVSSRLAPADARGEHPVGVDFPAHPTLDVAALLGLDGPTVAKLAYRITIDVTVGIPDRAS